MIKRIDFFLITSFIPPFLVAFSISLFVLVMQILWVYLDDLAGKGLGFFMVMELLGYRCMGIVPMALPLGVLLASVMVMGNLAEYYELSSFKSAGVSLLRVMAPLMVFAAGISVFSWYCSDTLIPIANLKFGSRMFDIKQKKPTLQLDEGVFNDDFNRYTIYIGRRLNDGRNIENVLIYDQGEISSGKVTQIVAKSGEMFISQDGKYFVMRLRDGYQYIDAKGYQNNPNQGKYPFVRTGFKQYTKVFNLSEFELNRTNERLFKGNRQMMTADQLKEASDSLKQEQRKRAQGIHDYVMGYIGILKPQVAPAPSVGVAPPPTSTEAPAPPQIAVPEDNTIGLANFNEAGTFDPLANGYQPRKPYSRFRDISQVAHFYETFAPEEQERLRGKVETVINSVLNQSESMLISLNQLREQNAKFIYDRHTKYSIAVVCFIFLFIGAPMGAIIRKGGFGYPILISVIFFVLFVTLTIFCRKIAESFVVSGEVAAWIPCIILFPIGLFLTYRAMYDQELFQFNQVWQWIKTLAQALPPFRRTAWGKSS